MKNDETRVVKIHDVKIDQEYMQWLGEIKARYRNAQIKAVFPESKGFSTTNLWRMKQWYLFYSQESQKLPQVVGEIQIPDNQSGTILQQLIGELWHTEDSQGHPTTISG